MLLRRKLDIRILRSEIFGKRGFAECRSTVKSVNNSVQANTLSDKIVFHYLLGVKESMNDMKCRSTKGYLHFHRSQFTKDLSVGN